MTKKSKQAADQPRPGRPRSARADAAILVATVAALAEKGFAALSVEQVAAEAGVSKATIYRRYPTKEDLVLAALSTVGAAAEAPDTGSLRGDLLRLAEVALEAAHGDPRRLLAMPRLVTEAGATDPKLFKAVHRSLIAPRRDAIKTVLERGVERGELPPGLDTELVADLYFGPLVFYVMRTGGRGPELGTRTVTVVDQLLATLAPDPGK